MFSKLLCFMLCLLLQTDARQTKRRLRNGSRILKGLESCDKKGECDGKKCTSCVSGSEGYLCIDDKQYGCGKGENCYNRLMLDPNYV